MLNLNDGIKIYNELEEGMELVNHYALEYANAVIVNGRNIFVL